MTNQEPIPEAQFVRVDTTDMAKETAYRLIIGCVSPRPIAWVTTQDLNGHVNAAPFSSYNYVATEPPMLAINIALRSGTVKDTARNIRETGEFVVNVATEANMEMMHRSAADYPSEVSEPAEIGIALIPSRFVKAPRIAVSLVQMECKLHQIVELGPRNSLYIGEVIAFHLWSEIYDGHNVDTTKMRPVSRIGGPYYASLGTIFHRPMLQKAPGS